MASRSPRRSRSARSPGPGRRSRPSPPSPPEMPAEAALIEALSQVRDPELDEPITDLGFVSELHVDGPRVRARLRLPTYFCAPNFAYLMVADAQEALAAVDGVHEANVTLDDHFASGEINEGVAARRDFAGTFPGLADDDDL